MKIKCIEKKLASLPKNILEHYSSYSIERLVVGKEYVVYAIVEFNGYVGYGICDENTDSYPNWYPINYFEITDQRLSRFWIFSVRENNTKEKKGLFLSFPEWANNEYFYDGLTDGDENESTTFAAYKKLMDLEFPDHSIIEKAQIGDENWLMCPLCIDAWQCNDKKNAMVVCPRCKQTLHNPRYNEERLSIDATF